jgi:hypothetical protein
MSSDPRRPVDSAPPTAGACGPHEPTPLSPPVAEGGAQAPPGRDHADQPRGMPDPVNRWATEHYGFDDEPVVATAVTVPPPVERPRATRRLHRRALLAGVLTLTLTGAVGGAAVAADLGDGGPGGRDGLVQIDRTGGNGGLDRADGFNGPGDGGRDGGFR